MHSSDAKLGLPGPQIPLPPIIDVWVVEGDLKLRNQLASQLNQTVGLSCPVSFPVVEEAIPFLTSTQLPHCILLDVDTPGERAPGVIGDCLRTAPALQIVALSGTESTRVWLDAIAAGAVSYMANSASPR